MKQPWNLCRIYNFYVRVIWLHRLQKPSSVTNNVVGKGRHSKIEVLLVLGSSSQHSASPRSRTPQQQIQLINEKENTTRNLIRMTGCIWIKNVSTCKKKAMQAMRYADKERIEQNIWPSGRDVQECTVEPNKEFNVPREGCASRDDTTALTVTGENWSIKSKCIVKL